MAFEQIGLEAILEGVSDFISDGNALNDTVSAMGGAFDAGASLIGGAGDLIGSAIGGIVDAALDLASSAGGALINFFGDSFSGALDAETTMARLTAQIEAQGPAAAITADQANALADEYKNLAGGSDDAVIAAEAVLLKFGSISEETFPNAIQTSADLAALMGTDLSTAAQTLGYALENPGANLAKLAKQTGAFTEEEIKQIQAMADAGDTAGAQALILSNLNDAIGGTAQTLADTTAGQWTIFQETMADAGETIMSAFLPALNGILAGLQPLIPVVEAFGATFGFAIADILSGDVGLALDDLREGMFGILEPLGFSTTQIQAFNDILFNVWTFIQANIPLVQTTFETVFTAVQSIFQVLSDFVAITFMPAIASIWEQTGIQLPTAQATFENVMAGIVTATQMVSDFITNVLVPVMTDVVNWIVTNWPAIQATAIEVWTQVQTAINTAVTFIQGLLDSFLPQITTNVSTTLSGLTAFWDAHGTQIMAIVSNTFNTIASIVSVTLALVGTTVSTSLTLLSGIFATTMQLVNGDWSGAWTTITSTITTALNGILALVGQDLSSFSTIWTTNWNNFILIVTTVWDNIVSGISAGISNLLGIIGGAVYDIGNAFVSIDWTSFGSYVINGIISGISGAVGSLVNAAVSAAQAAFNAAKAALGISSPSTVFMEVGEESMIGWAIGIQENEDIVVAAAEDVAATVINCTVDELSQSLPLVANAASDVAYAIEVGMDLPGLCSDLSDQAYDIGANCIPSGIQSGIEDGLPSITDSIGQVWDSTTGSITPYTNPIGESTTPVTTGGVSTGGNMVQTSNTYQYAPTYGGTPVSPERDFAMMQVLAGV